MFNIANSDYIQKTNESYCDMCLEGTRFDQQFVKKKIV